MKAHVRSGLSWRRRGRGWVPKFGDGLVSLASAATTTHVTGQVLPLRTMVFFPCAQSEPQSFFKT